MTDEQLVAKIQDGKTQEFSILYDKYIRKIYDFIYFKLYHQETAEDLTSTTFLKALEKIDKFNSRKGKFQAWLYQIAHNTVIDYFRTNKKTVDIEDVWDLSDKCDVAHEVDNRVQMEEVRQVLKKLKPTQRQIVLLRLWQGLSHQEIADITGKSAANCKMIFSRSLKIIKSEALVNLFIILLAG